MEILTLGEKIKRRRKELDMTLKDLAADRITPGQISLVESGRSNPSMDLLEYLAGALKTSTEYLMESEETQAEKICMYYEQMAEAYILTEDYITAEKYIENAMFYAEKYNLEYRKAKNLYLRATIHKEKDELVLAQQYYLSANVIFIKNNNCEQVVNTFLNLGKITLELKAFHSATSYLRQAEKVYLDNNIGNDAMLGEIYYIMAEGYFKIDNIKKSMDYAFLAKQKFEQLQNKEEYGKALLLLAQDYNKNGDLANAIKYSKKTLEVYTELKEEKSISTIENNLGKLFFEFDNVEEAFKHYQIAKEIQLRRKDSNIVETLFNICEGYIKIKELHKCEEVLFDIGRLIDESNVEHIVEKNLLWYRVYTIREMYSEAEYVLIDTFNLAKNSGLYNKAAQIAIMIGKFYIEFKRDFEAAKYLDEGVNIFKEIGILNN
ncbi:tetratricopeptide repeat protein [Clostridium celatum]|uniref:tetratricopeptide repeat protein n=1 Tax=Clostridium celatum TaxID=36834 RepID=UPI00189A2AF3|nr:tetratricopeptide repeat protein [Clostridium celatum]MCE9655916.1 helix-turn-helix transcriptional regulator [Clostridium celatum]MDU6294845.1 helix-turn-helix transcriptional regulator [Clostridium celatum]MDY3360787.1 helix-turn-helix transcriptional regulator [Clostridium celatum]